MKFKSHRNLKVVTILCASFTLAVSQVVLFPAQASNGKRGRSTQIEFYKGEEVTGQGLKGLRRSLVSRSVGSVRRGAKALLASERSLLPAPQLNQRVLVVYNAGIPASLNVADHYVARRGIPQSHKCAISPPTPRIHQLGRVRFHSQNPDQELP